MSRPLTVAEGVWLREVGMRLRLRRVAAGDTQRSLADRAGVATVTISHIERGADLGGVVTLVRLCRALDWSLSEPVGEAP